MKKHFEEKRTKASNQAANIKQLIFQAEFSRDTRQEKHKATNEYLKQVK